MPLPDRETETRVLAAHAAGFDPRDLRAAGLRQVATAEALAAARQAVGQVTISAEITA